MRLRKCCLALLTLLAFGLVTAHNVYAQTPAADPSASAGPVVRDASATPALPPSATAAEPPLPDIPTLLRDVEANQRKAEALQRDYIYHSVLTRIENDGHGQPKKTIVEEFDTYWVNGVQIGRLMRRNGKDLPPDEIAKEDARIDKQTAKAHQKREQADAQGKETDSHGNEEITVSRLLELGSFTNARRVQWNGRNTIAFDYLGDPRAKTRNRTEDAIRDLQGTVWIDEQDHMLTRMEEHFVNDFKIGGGLLANIHKDTHFSMEQTKVNGEVWLRSRVDGAGNARTLLFFNFNGSFHVVDSDYRKFRATATILPGTTPVAAPDAPPPAP